MNKRITIASALEIIASGTRDKGLDCETMQKFPRETSYLQRKLHLTKMQCYIVAVMLDNAGDPVSPDDLADHAEASRIFILGQQNEMDMLVDRGVINVVGGGRHDVWNMHYMPSESLVQAVSHNHELRPEVMSDLTYEEQPPAPPNKQTIVPKNMFYNEDERKHILRLEALLCKDSFVSIQQRMREAGLRTGFCCLFYGAPGTGKTETVLQMARHTGREIIRVDLSSQKSMWVGESEKNIERIFADYREKLSQSELAPILLFNEADAIFSKRHVGVNSEVEQMANTMQNILLQNMENFEGILIATTNLADNFDPAFHRRFLYRIEFKSPSAEVRKQIWRSMLPNMDESNIKAMAERFSISGGQIENAVRKIMIESILKGCPLSTDEIVAICEQEVQKKRVTLKKLCV